MATTCVALLRAVNVGGRASLAMSDLRTLVERLGFENPRTVLQSGNVVFSAARGTPASIETRLEGAIAAGLSLETDVFVRSAAQWGELVRGNPFPEEARTDPSRLIVMYLKAAPSAPAVTRLVEGIRGRERMSAVGRHLYIVYPDGMGRSKLTASALEKALSTRGTARNWNTVLKVAALAAEP